MTRAPAERMTVEQSRVARYRAILSCALDRNAEALRLMMKVAVVDELDVDERHQEMDALLLALVPSEVAQVFLDTKRWYS